MTLDAYRRKRDFERTAEPKGEKGRTDGRSFVVQKHAARALHYDFRLELDGVLLSWAVPKGPSRDPRVKRLAMQTEDHPVEYGGFEGVIPKGEYGGGSVIVWDRGTWVPEGDPHEAYSRGRLTFELRGEKLRGGFHLIRTGGGKRGERRWLLVKRNDADAQPGSEGAIVEDLPDSVLTGRGVEEVAERKDKTWHSKKKTSAVRRESEPAARTTRATRHIVHMERASTSGGPTTRGSAERPPQTKQRPAATSPRDTAKHASKPSPGGRIDVDPSRIRLTHPDRVLYPDKGLTKADLALYYTHVARFMLPHLAGRPLTLVRCPEGAGKQCFYQKHPTQGTPDAVARVPIAEKKGKKDYMVVHDAEGLVGLVQVDALEIHTWGSRIDDVEKPDQLVFDLDPDENLPWARVAEAATTLRTRLEAVGLTAFVKTTGGKGLHLVVPLVPDTPWDGAKAFSKSVVDAMVRDEPRKYLATMTKEKRKGKIFLDYLRNARGATSVCVYSTRARAGAPVSTPVAWDEITGAEHPDGFDVRTVSERLGRLERDPWEGFDAARARMG